MADNEPFERKAFADYVEDRQKLLELRAPGMRITYGDDRDIAYQQERQLAYALDMIGHLLRRIEILEDRE